jgi:hypothetical protein
MPLICKDCKNKERFGRSVYGRCDYSEYKSLDQYGNMEDSHDIEYDNHEETDTDRATCRVCGSSNVMNVSDDVWEAWNGPVKSWQTRFPKKRKK